jgi:S1-C subfamily serine protease
MPATLHFTTGSWSGKVIALPEPQATIGRDPALEVVIPLEDQRFVSRVHATIGKEGDRYVIRDRDSSNGTFVNRLRVQHAVLADRDEIQFGRQGPVARFRCDTPPVETRVEIGQAAAAPRHDSPAAIPPPAPKEAPSQMVRRIVSEAMATGARRSRLRLAAAAIVVAVAAIVAGAVAVRLRLFESDERAFARLADEYQRRVVLVEVGIAHNRQYLTLGYGSGFFADRGGLIVTNKHVIHSDLYSREAACVAESFRRRGLSYEKALVITVWPGGTDFRQSPASPSGDRSLGFSTDHDTLSLVVTAPDELRPATTVQCRDTFGGPAFTFAWRAHATNNQDLAILKAATAIEPIPLADGEPATDDAVMVLGFPTGTVPLETNKAEPIRRVGSVLRTRDTIQIDAVVLGGNSGGPLIDRNGAVVGVTTRGPAESLNMAIKVEHVRRLLERAHNAS